MRVLTERPWKRDIHVIVQSSEDELWARQELSIAKPFQTRHSPSGCNFLLGQLTGSCGHRCKYKGNKHIKTHFQSGDG